MTTTLPRPRDGQSTMTRSSRRYARCARTGAWVLVAVLPATFLAIFFAWPVVAMTALGFVTNGQIDVTGVTATFASARTWQLVGATLAQAVMGTTLAVLLGVPGAHVLYRRTFRGQRIARGLVTVPFVLPTVVVGVAFRALLTDGGPLGFLALDETFAAVVLALVFFNYSVVVRTVGGTWAQLDPRTEQAARALGAGPWRVWWTVTLPAIGPAVASAASVVFLFCATAFGVVLVLGGTGYRTLETEIWVRTTQFLDLRTAAVLSIVQLAVVVLALAVAAHVRHGRDGTRRSGHTHPPRALRLWAGSLRRPGPDLAPVVLSVLVVGTLLVMPLAVLVVRSLRTRDGTWTLAHYAALGHSGDPAVPVTVWGATVTSVTTAAMATAIAIVIGAAVALIVSRRPRHPTPRRAIAVLDALFMLPLGVSAVTVGFGFLVTLDRPLGLPVDLRASGLLVPLAQAVVAIPLVVRTVVPVLRAIDPRQHEVAATLGAPPGRILRTIDLRVAARPVGVAIGCAFAVSLGEFGATSFLARPGEATLPVLIVRLIGRPGEQNQGMALAACVVLAVLTASIMMVAERCRGNRNEEW